MSRAARTTVGRGLLRSDDGWDDRARAPSSAVSIASSHVRGIPQRGMPHVRSSPSGVATVVRAVLWGLMIGLVLPGAVAAQESGVSPSRVTLPRGPGSID